MSEARNKCQSEEVAAYLDGELDGTALGRFEEHVQQCLVCASELRAQRQLLCTLDVAFNNSRAFDLPSNFARVVTARAENDLTGMRDRGERKRAVQLCVLLALISFGLLGAATRAIVFDPLRSFLRTTRVLSDLLWQAISDSVSAAAVLARVIGRGVLDAQPGSRFLLAFAFLLSVCCLSFLIVRYRRAQVIE
ncbi:MAG TPA: zf-HC2 domain-containing protein [Pyrinomonadaceae bacterium]|jgi:anti-sigma factor RsiW|nr:zf-HC2 domain-containing protein [Pyrinomonadaceae bacterium]